MNIKIEYGTYADLDEMEQLYNDLNDALTAGVNYPGWKKDVYPTRDDAVAGIDGHHLFVARSNHKIVGSIILNHKPEQGYSDAPWNYHGDYGNVLVVHTLAIRPSFLKLGIGKQLLHFAESFGRKNNIKSIRLDVYEKNTPAIQLYEYCGYEYIATVDLGYGAFGLEQFNLYEKLLL